MLRLYGDSESSNPNEDGGEVVALYIEFFAEADLIGGLSTCPGGDCSAKHSSNHASCFPLLVEIFKPDTKGLDRFPYLPKSPYSGAHQD